MRRAMSVACTAEPPGELMARATALTWRSLKARSMGVARLASPSPRRSGPIWPMTPAKRSTATTGGGRRRRARRRTLPRRAMSIMGRAAAGN